MEELRVKYTDLCAKLGDLNWKYEVQRSQLLKQIQDLHHEYTAAMASNNDAVASEVETGPKVPESN